MKIKKLRGMLALILLGLSGVGIAAPVSVDFSTYAPDTPLTYAGGISFSLIGSPDSAGAPTISHYDAPYDGLLTNTRHGGDYPTANILQFTFDSLVGGVSFVFNNAGTGTTGGRGDSYFEAFDASGGLLETGSLNSALNDIFTLSAAGIKTIQFNNGTGGKDSWWFGVGSISATTVPAPGGLALLGLGLISMGFARRKKA